MSGPLDFTNQNIENTYQRVLQTDGTDIYDGTGSLFTVTAVATPAGPDKSVQFNDNGATGGSGNFTFDSGSSTVLLTGSLISSGSVSFPALTSLQQSNVVIIDTASGQLYYTASSAFGGGTTTVPGNPNKSIQFNGNGVFSGSNNFTFDSASNTMTLTGSMTTTGSNTLVGNTILSGTLQVQGQYPPSAGSASVSIVGNMDLNGFLRFDPVTSSIDTSISASYIYVSGSTQDLYFSQNGSGYANVTRLRWLEGNLYTGLLHGGALSQVNSNTYRVASGSGIIVNLNASLNDDPYPTIQFLEWDNLTKTIDALSASFDQQFISISSSNQIHAQGTPYFNGEVDTYIPIGIVLHQNRTSINGVKTQPSVAYGWKQRSNVFISAFGPLKISGHALLTSSSRGLTIGSGTSFADGANYPTDPENPSYVTDPGTNVSKIFRYRQSGSNWVYDTNAGAGYTTIDPTQYSLNGTLTSVGAGNWSIQRVFWYPNSVSKAIVVYYGNAIYSTEAEAIANINIETFSEAPNTAANAIYVGSVIINGTGVFTSPSDFTLIPGGLFRGVGGGGGGGGTTTPGGSNTQIQYNNNGAFGGVPNLTWDGTTLHATGSFTGSFTGSLLGTSSYATTASYALNGGVTQLIAGSNISLSPSNGLGQVTISSTGGGGIYGNTATGSYGSFYDTTIQNLSTINVPLSMSLNTTDISNGVSISGSVDPYNTYIKMANAGVYDIQFSAQIDKTTGTNSVVYIWLRKNGVDLAETNTSVTLAGGANDKALAAWNWFVNAAAGDYFQLMWAGTNNNVRLYATGSGAIDAAPAIPSLIVTANRIDQFLSNTGSFTGSFTGQLIGTASWASQAISSSYALSASYALTSSYALSSSYAESSSYSLSSSYSDTASYALNGLPPGTSGQILQIDTSDQYQLQTALNDTAGATSLDIDGRALYWNDGTTLVFEYRNRGKIYDNTGIEAISFLDGNSRFLYDKVGTASLDYDNRFLLYADGITPAISYALQDKIDITGSVFVSGSLTVSGSGTFTNIGPAIFSGSVTSTGGFTGSLLGTASWANNALTSSYAINAITSSYPISVLGTTIYSVVPGGLSSGNNNAIFLGASAGSGVTTAYNSNFIGYIAGQLATNAYQSNFIGAGAGLEATRADNSNFIGLFAGQKAVSASFSTLIGYQAGATSDPLTSIGTNNIIIGTNITLPTNTRNSINLGAIIFATGSYSTLAGNPYSGSQSNIGRVGINIVNPQYTLDVSGSGNYSNGLTVTGSLTAPSITGSLQGTASWAQSASNAINAQTSSFLPVATYNITASWAQSASNAINAQTASFLPVATYNITSSWAVSASQALTASFVTASNVIGTVNSASYALSASYATNGGVTQIIAGTNITISPTNGLGAVTINSAGGTGGAGANITASFTNQSTWTFTHALGNRGVVVQTFDTSWNQIIPQNITLTDANTATITFPSNESGFAIASLGGVVSTAATASYVLNAVSSSFASTASFVNTLNQNVIITGSVAIGTGSIGNGENNLLLGPAPAGGVGEGGQIALLATGGIYTSSSFLDNYQNQFRVLSGPGATSNAGVLAIDLGTRNATFQGAVTASGFNGLPNDYLYVTRNTNQTIGGGNWANQDVIFNNSVVSKGISYNTGTGLASLTGGKVYRITARLAWNAAAVYLFQFSCYNSSNTQLGPTVEMVQSTNSSNNISDGTLDFIYAPGSNVDIKIRTTNNTTALSGEYIRGDLNTQLIIQQIA